MDGQSNAAPAGNIEAICASAAAGDVEALTTLLALHHNRLLEHSIRKVGPDWRGKLDPEDVLQETYLDIFAGISAFKYKGLDSFYHWAAQIVDRRYIDQIRRQRAAKRDVSRERSPVPPETNTSSYQGLLEQCLRDSKTPSRFATTAEAISAAMSGMARLPEDYRLVLRRHYIDGDSLTTIATDMGRTEDAIRRLASRALDRLREFLPQIAS